MNPIEAAIAAAKANAAAMLATQGANVPVEMPAAAPTVQYATPVKPVSLDDLLDSSMAVDVWLKVSQFGLTVAGDNKTLRPTIKAVIYKPSIKAYHGLKSKGQPPKYWKSLDGVTDISGVPWTKCIADAQRTYPEGEVARSYPTADIPFVLAEDIINSAGELKAAKGKILGHTLSTTNWKFFKLFMDELKAKGLENEHVPIEIGFESQQKGTNNWGNITFKILTN